MDVGVCPRVREEDFSGIGFDIGEGVEDMPTCMLLRQGPAQREMGQLRTHVRLSTGMRDGGNFLP